MTGATMSARAIAAALGGQVAGINTVLCPGPGHSRRDRSLAVLLDPNAPDGFVCFSHAGDDWKECRDHIRQRLGLRVWQPCDAHQRPSPARDTDAADELERISYARGIWNEAADPRGTLAEIYLRQHRKLDVPDELCGAVLRFDGACLWPDARRPALVVPFRTINGNTITGVHRIALNADGSLIARRMLGPMRGCAIKLDQIDGDAALVIGEGVETCMAARELMAMGQLPRMPVWALGSAGPIGFFPLIDGIARLFVLTENNDDGRNALAVTTLRMRWHKAGRRIIPIIPHPRHDDMNDVLIAIKARIQVRHE
jgi:hypothetical protein